MLVAYGSLAGCGNWEFCMQLPWAIVVAAVVPIHHSQRFFVAVANTMRAGKICFAFT